MDPISDLNRRSEQLVSQVDIEYGTNTDIPAFASANGGLRGSISASRLNSSLPDCTSITSVICTDRLLLSSRKYRGAHLAAGAMGPFSAWIGQVINASCRQD
jgi:hypothetical protein